MPRGKAILCQHESVCTLLGITWVGYSKGGQLLKSVSRAAMSLMVNPSWNCAQHSRIFG